jgi:3,4-dihydroxy 2-butanone 4-phosphate synthase/GTP cyclohydrolase II
MSAIMRLSSSVHVPLPTPYGNFEMHAFEPESGHVHVALVVGDVDGEEGVLTRVHSECLTGDVLGSLRCDCGVQLHQSLRRVAAEGRGVVIYATGHEGRGIGLINKLRAYVLQDRGADTVQANHALGLPADARRYDDSAAVLRALGVRSVRLLTNNPHKSEGLSSCGTVIDEIVPLPTTPQHHNARYLATKAKRMGHHRPGGPAPEVVEGSAGSAGSEGEAIDVLGLLGSHQPKPDRPTVVLKYAQTIDGRIATASGDSRWISGEQERRLAHALRAASDAVLVGVGTVLQDDPQLTVRMVDGASPARAVLDSTLRTPPTARILEPEAATTIITTDRSSAARQAELRAQGVTIHVVAEGDGHVDLTAALAALRSDGIETLLVEGGAEVITALLRERLVDRVIVSIAPLIIGTGTSAVADLAIGRVADGVKLVNRSIVPVGDDVVIAWDVQQPR